MEKKITLDTTVEEVVTLYPSTVKIFFKYGIPCIACGAPIWGTIGENVKKYQVKDVEGLLKELNQVASLGIEIKMD